MSSQRVGLYRRWARVARNSAPILIGAILVSLVLPLLWTPAPMNAQTPATPACSSSYDGTWSGNFFSSGTLEHSDTDPVTHRPTQIKEDFNVDFDLTMTLECSQIHFQPEDPNAYLALLKITSVKIKDKSMISGKPLDFLDSARVQSFNTWLPIVRVYGTNTPDDPHPCPIFDFQLPMYSPKGGNALLIASGNLTDRRTVNAVWNGKGGSVWRAEFYQWAYQEKAYAGTGPGSGTISQSFNLHHETPNPVPDLTVSQITVNTDIVTPAGNVIVYSNPVIGCGPMVVGYTITNEGDKYPYQNVPVGVYLSRWQYGTEEVFFYQDWINPSELGPGKKVERTVYGTIPNWNEGDYWVSIWVDNKQVIYERDLKKRIYSEPFHARPFDITWEKPADIEEGTLLSEIQLNATADVDGTFQYSPDFGAKLGPGRNQILHVDFTPTVSTGCGTTSKDVNINVLRATPVITPKPPPGPTPPPPIIRFALTTSANPPGGGTVAGGGTYTRDTQVTIQAIPNSGWVFKGWSGDCYGSGSCVVTMTGNKSVTANFEQHFTLTTSANPPDGGTVTGGGTYTQGTRVTLTASPGAGYQFQRWSGAVTSANNPINITMDADKAVTASFIQPQVRFALTTSVNPSESGTVSINPNPDADGKYDRGTHVTLTASPSASYQFQVWSGSATGTTNPITITMDADKAVTASFVAASPCAPVPSTLNFDAVNTYAPAYSVDATSYLSSFCISLSGVTPWTQVVVMNSQGLYGGKAAQASSSPNLLTQTGSNDAVRFTLNFATPVNSVSFTRAALLAGPNGITHPEWSAHALNMAGVEVAQASEAQIASFSNVPARTFTLTGAGIKSVRFDSNNRHIAVFNAVLIDDLVIELPLTTPTPTRTPTPTTKPGPLDVSKEMIETFGTIAQWRRDRVLGSYDMIEQANKAAQAEADKLSFELKFKFPDIQGFRDRIRDLADKVNTAPDGATAKKTLEESKSGRQDIQKQFKDGMGGMKESMKQAVATLKARTKEQMKPYKAFAQQRNKMSIAEQKKGLIQAHMTAQQMNQELQAFSAKLKEDTKKELQAKAMELNKPDLDHLKAIGGIFKDTKAKMEAYQAETKKLWPEIQKQVLQKRKDIILKQIDAKIAEEKRRIEDSARGLSQADRDKQGFTALLAAIDQPRRDLEAALEKALTAHDPAAIEQALKIFQQRREESAAKQISTSALPKLKTSQESATKVQEQLRTITPQTTQSQAALEGVSTWIQDIGRAQQLCATTPAPTVKQIQKALRKTEQDATEVKKLLQEMLTPGVKQ